jgi:hypothetical protein
MFDLGILQALANDRLLQIMEWLKEPAAHFRPQFDGDLPGAWRRSAGNSRDRKLRMPL